MQCRCAQAHLPCSKPPTCRATEEGVAEEASETVLALLEALVGTTELLGPRAVGLLWEHPLSELVQIVAAERKSSPQQGQEGTNVSAVILVAADNQRHLGEIATVEVHLGEIGQAEVCAVDDGHKLRDGKGLRREVRDVLGKRLVTKR